MPRDDQQSTTLSKCLMVLDLLARAKRPLTYTDIRESTGLPKSTSYRLISILTNERLIHFDPESRAYRIGYRLLELAAQGLNGFDLRQIAAPGLRTLGKTTQESVLLAVRDGHEIVYIDRVESTRSLRFSTAVGNRAPLHCTGLGKAIMAFLGEEVRLELSRLIDFHPFTENTITTFDALERELALIRARGFAIDDMEHQPDIRCVAVPIFSRQGEVVAALSISAPSSRADRKHLESWAPLVRDAAAQISREMGWGGT